MTDKNDTPRGLEPSSDGVNDWVRYQLVRIFDRTKTIEKKVDEVQVKQKVFEEFRLKTEIRLAEGSQKFSSLDKQIGDLRNNRLKNNPNSNTITFKWLVEELGTPVVTGIVTAILVAAIILWATGS